MTPWKQKLILGLGVAMTFAMTQTSDAQLFRFRRSACPQPAVNQSCCQNGAANIAPEVTYEMQRPLSQSYSRIPQLLSNLYPSLKRLRR